MYVNCLFKKVDKHQTFTYIQVSRYSLDPSRISRIFNYTTDSHAVSIFKEIGSFFQNKLIDITYNVCMKKLPRMPSSRQVYRFIPLNARKSKTRTNLKTRFLFYLTI